MDLIDRSTVRSHSGLVRSREAVATCRMGVELEGQGDSDSLICPTPWLATNSIG